MANDEDNRGTLLLGQSDGSVRRVERRPKKRRRVLPMLAWAVALGAVVIGGKIGADAYVAHRAELRAQAERAAAIEQQAAKAAAELERQKSEKAAAVERYQADMRPLSKILERWADEEKLASQTPRISLGDRVASMQAIEREAHALELHDPCLKVQQAVLVSAMRATTDGFIDFIGKNELSAQKEMEDGVAQQHSFIDGAKACKPQSD